jgi:hypothetical protein
MLNAPEEELLLNITIYSLVSDMMDESSLKETRLKNIGEKFLDYCKGHGLIVLDRGVRLPMLFAIGYQIIYTGMMAFRKEAERIGCENIDTIMPKPEELAGYTMV